MTISESTIRILKKASCPTLTGKSTLTYHIGCSAESQIYFRIHANDGGGFYMAPLSGHRFHVICDNQFEGDLSADALGITACLYSYSHLSFSGTTELADICNEHYHQLREFMLEHPEVRAILGAID